MGSFERYRCSALGSAGCFSYTCKCLNDKIQRFRMCHQPINGNWILGQDRAITAKMEALCAVAPSPTSEEIAAEKERVARTEAAIAATREEEKIDVTKTGSAPTKLAACEARCFALYRLNPAKMAMCITQCVTEQAPTPPTPTSPEQCPRGLRYTKLTRWGTCDPGYVSTKGSGMTVLGQSIYPYMPGNECVCIASEAGKAIVAVEGAPKPTDLPIEPGINGNGELGDLGKYTPYLLLAGVAALILSMIKR